MIQQPTTAKPRISTSSKLNTVLSKNKENVPGKLFKKFKCPSLVISEKRKELPLRKKPRVNYSEYGSVDGKYDSAYVSENVSGLATIKEANRLILNHERRDPSTVIKKQFSVPKPIKGHEDISKLCAHRPPPTLGMKRKVDFIPRPLYDPADEFAIVLYDPTTDADEIIPDIKEVLAEKRKKDELLKNRKGKKEISDSEPESDHDSCVSTDTVASCSTEQSLITSNTSKHRRPNKSLKDLLGIQKEKPPPPPVAVVIDPKLARILRPHQIEGVKFLYKCVTGRIDRCANGCIMADEMGLGKTLQCIALLWTLLKQSPQAGKPTIEKAIITCPSSLVKNWANELVKWLGKDAITPFILDGKSSKQELIMALQQWASVHGRQVTRPVLIASYETLRSYVEHLNNAEIGMLLCDEGHRLKNSDSLTFTALDKLNVQRRVILSGTPIQNDLSEYFSLLNFANPGLLGSRQEFRKNYEIPILKGRDADGTEKDKENGDAKLAELAKIVNRFIIRRTNDILSKYLPVKYEHVVFCNLSEFQLSLYKHFITSPEINKILRGTGSQPLKAIGLLKKICNHPDLLNLTEDLEGCEALFPPGFIPRELRGRDRNIDSSLSGKMLVLERMLYQIKQETDDKIVLISNYTSTLDLFEQLCRARGYKALRLDGTMNVNKRQRLVDTFNDPEKDAFVFLLSSKAGGCGINLIGANRLILFDPDWNPAADQQALARVWRDGQKKDCFVYRFIATGTIEEKIFQRQSHKQSLSSCVVDEAQDVERHFSLDNLRQLFQLNDHTVCETHETYKCKRCRDGKQFIRAPAMLYGDTSTWNHFTNPTLDRIEDHLLKREAGKQQVSTVFQYKSH
ncbi:DNA repair protein rhp54 [Schizosaccharomyces pombe]|uniref:DNA repair protein rhp54 n=1 Tax=Schizosaccharomyces pombe (strain 972 / ATCC 24843) TaxID=284812 RepID=RAD54_SCHPO|nr:DNA repair protein [Schizosaccharomyces pombe]P41410.2 RecName: Full=DNA repair protein rhp54; AltName: Full=RAD54 homolog 1 [Schizosaccharomyces pombe 972h-]CAB10100.1 Rad54 homolog Rhp54 [Schizosaccharomyces pombe]|eukprot:NP_594290.1 DNA repair protein [Schizosaccharomyces pombe]